MHYLAHSTNAASEVDLLQTHLQLVAERAAEYAEAFNASSEAYVAGLLHDLGKYGDNFQKRLRGEIRGVDHWSVGAWIALTKYQALGIASALSIQGHHIGLQQASKDSLRDLNPEKLKEMHPLGLTLSDPDPAKLLERMAGDGLELPRLEQITDSIYEHSDIAKASLMLDIRMLFSTLVDADFIETEAHFNATHEGARVYRETGIALNADYLLTHLLKYLDNLALESAASIAVRKMRFDLLKACLAAATRQRGLFTLTAPTGAGKTLSMLAFAIKHASFNKLDRIIMVIPYLSIIDQTVSEFRKALTSAISGDDMGKFILEHHSLAGTHIDKGAVASGSSPDEQKSSYLERLLSENWDAPIIITTSVQFLESLFSNRPSSCRKLHRMANSVILFDEVQTLPVGLAIPTLATLSHLSDRYNSSIVFSTATQPAFSHLDAHIRKFCTCGWNPVEIVPESFKLYERVRRTEVIWPQHAGMTVSWADLAAELADESCRQVLCIVNLKRHALALYQLLLDIGATDVFHLSTNMCPTHRMDVLKEVRFRLSDGMPCRLVSTQCIEAGVDVDFPCVYRALGPLDAIAQAAGRCNRNGLFGSGKVVTYIPESIGQERIYPDDAYRQATGVTHLLLSEYGGQGIDINSPKLFADYYRELYEITRPEERKKRLLEAIDLRDFGGVADNYRIIEKSAINILVPYDLEHYQKLEQEVRNSGLNGRWIAEARPYAVGMFKPRINDPAKAFIEPVRINMDNYSDEWFIYLFREHYSPRTGLNPPGEMECFIA